MTWHWSLFLALTACESAAEKCQRIELADVLADIDRSEVAAGRMASDSAHAPPKPSEVWYGEHCWEGRPR